ncbi:MAG: hypothetical protein Q9194_007563, partial [Teloschistes cf. exilis]
SSSVKPETIELAWQLSEYLASNSKAPNSSATRDLVAFVTSNYPQPKQSSASRQGSRSSRSSATEPLKYPSDWAHNITSYRGALRRIQEYTSALQSSEAFQEYKLSKLPDTLPKMADNQAESSNSQSINTQAPSNTQAFTNTVQADPPTDAPVQQHQLQSLEQRIEQRFEQLYRLSNRLWSLLLHQSLPNLNSALAMLDTLIRTQT